MDSFYVLYELMINDTFLSFETFEEALDYCTYGISTPNLLCNVGYIWQIIMDYVVYADNRRTYLFFGRY